MAKKKTRLFDEDTWGLVQKMDEARKLAVKFLRSTDQEEAAKITRSYLKTVGDALEGWWAMIRRTSIPYSFTAKMYTKDKRKRRPQSHLRWIGSDEIYQARPTVFDIDIEEGEKRKK